MRGRLTTLWGTALAIVLAVVPVSSALAGEFLIDIGGTPAISVRGECAVMVDGEREHAEFRTLIPKQYLLIHEAQQCCQTVV